MEGENVPRDFTKSEDSVALSKWMEQYCELRRHLFKKHIKSLSHEEQSQFKRGIHPSQSHSFADRAEPFAAALKEEMEGKGSSCEVRLGWYHMDRIVLICDLVHAPDVPENLPWLFRGFEIKYDWPMT